MLTVSVLFSAEFFHLRGNQNSGVKEIRKTIAETLAVQLSALASVSDVAGIEFSVSSFVSRNDNVLAAALNTADGVVISEYGDLQQLEDVDKGSSATHLNVPIFHENAPWGDVKVVFKKPETLQQDLRYFLYVLVGCFISYLLFLYRALIDLDPSRVVPARVNTAFNMFSEGVVILDKKMRILLANESVAEIMSTSTDQLVGQSIDAWQWQRPDDWQTPWFTTFNSGINVSDQPLRLDSDKDQPRIFMVSCTAIGDDLEGMRGVLVTLDNMTAIEQKNNELAVTLRKLRRSQESITQKNKELETLATKDPLTGLANRRALLEMFEREFQKAQREEKALSCVMVDIDHFKQVNDNHGHSVGDEILCVVSNALLSQCRQYDLVSRYGGEEFVLVMPGMDLEGAAAVAERIRVSIETLALNSIVPVDQLSASLGVAEFTGNIDSVLDLIEKADQALYAAKQGGRNRVVSYSNKLSVFSGPTDVQAALMDQQNSTLHRVAQLEAMVDQRTRDLENLREYDPLTGIPQKTIFLHSVETQMQRADRYGTQIGLLSLEISDLNRILSTFGQAATDKLIVDFVERIQTGLRRTDLVSNITEEHSLSRITSNEYGILLTDLDEFSQAMSVVARLRRELSEPFIVADQKTYIGASIGIALYPQGGETTTDLLDGANLARMDASRMSDKITHSFASSSLDNASRKYIQIEADLYEAFEAGQFEVYFQPKFELATQRVHSLETLIRWHHPEKGFVPPNEFIPILEANGLIHDLSEFVLSESLKHLNIWQVLGHDDLTLSINISPVQLREPTLVDSIVNALREADLQGSRLEVELTETSVIDSPARARVVLNELREAGIRISMDDFGTGYTSLALLADLPLDAVKIDRSFISAMDTSKRSLAIVESVINMAQALNLWVVAEGVETNDQLATLTGLGCDEIQGYLFARPMCAADVIEFLQQQRAVDSNIKRAG